MKVGVTGGSGFLGSETVSLLANVRSYTPVIIGRGGKQANYMHEYRVTDYSLESLMDVFKDLDAIVHLAAVRGTGSGISNFHPNEIITENLFEACSRLDIGNIVYASSIAVYSDESKIPWREDQLPSPKTLYGISKLACEYMANIYHTKYGLNVKSLRIAQVLGEGERKGYMMNTFIDNAFKKKQLHVIGKSKARREFVYVKDVAEAILLALSKKEVHGAFNIGSNEAYTNLEIAKIVNICFNNEGNLLYDDSRDEGISSSLMDSSKAREVLGYSPRYGLKEGLLDIKKQKIEGVLNV
ncbi:MAG TPA: NAD(P)-dependent oxidoreductase [Clostridiales bacterium]|nr:NAD(P)-dependent oxidoreductase [Clostridiales bacterium]